MCLNNASANEEAQGKKDGKLIVPARPSVSGEAVPIPTNAIPTGAIPTVPFPYGTP